jgi:hypothetical protein
MEIQNFRALYTHQKNKKYKVWQDGFVKWNKSLFRFYNFVFSLTFYGL